MARVAAAWAGAAVGLTVGACFIKPDAPGSDPTGDGGTSDGLGNDGLVTPCAIRDTFDGSGAACGGWGVRKGSAGSGGSGNQNIYRSNGELVMASSGYGGIAACEAVASIEFTRVVVQLVDVVMSPSGHTGVELRFANSGTFRVEVQAPGTQLAVHDGTQTTWSTFDPEVAYLQLERNNSNVSVSSSSDGSTWMNISNHGVASPLDTVTISLYTEFGSNTGYVLGAFDNLDGCAP